MSRTSRGSLSPVSRDEQSVVHQIEYAQQRTLAASVWRDVGGVLPGLREGAVGGKVAGEASNVVQVAQLAVLDVL